MTTRTNEILLLMDKKSKHDLAIEVLRLRSLCRDVYNDFDFDEVDRSFPPSVCLVWYEGKP